MGSGGQKKKNKGVRLGVGLLMMTFLLLLSSVWVVFDSLFAPFDTVGETVTIPDLEGMAAESVQTEPWIELETEYRYDPKTPAGVVLSQSPTGGSMRRISAASPTCKLRLTVSLGQETATVPEVIGMDVRVAESCLRAAGFTVKTEIRAGARPEGEVYDMTPTGGEIAPVGSSVTLYASAGEPQVTVAVPDLCGLTRGDALTRLWLSQLGLAEIFEVESDAEEGVVVRQDYRAGTVVMAGTKLTLYVSKRKE